MVGARLGYTTAVKYDDAGGWSEVCQTVGDENGNSLVIFGGLVERGEYAGLRIGIQS
jgi:hypothetical protein